MSLQTQAILQGHLTAAEIAVRIEQASRFKVLGYRTMRIPEHVLFELEDSGGNVLAVEAFLNSWAADDYASVFSGPSTLLTMEYSPEAKLLLLSVSASSGFWRENDISLHGWLRSPAV